MTTLNQGQSDAADAFAQFLFSPDPFFAISGPAGTGKTFLMNFLSNKGLQAYFDACKLTTQDPKFSSTVFTATTNKAAEVLEQSIGQPVQTIHSFLGLKVKENWKTGKTSIEKTSNWRLRKGIVVFIDECSMIDTELFKILLETFEESKIVFVGDDRQMAPINEDLSPVFAEVSLANFCALFEPVRNAGQPALMALCDQLRNTVQTGVFEPIAHVPGVVEYLNDAEMEAELSSTFTDLDPSARVLCYTNEQVNLFNEHIREDVRGLSDPISPGDVFVVAQAYQRGKIAFSVERELTVEMVGATQRDNSHAHILGSHVIEFVEVSFVGFGNEDDVITFPVCTNRGVLNFALKHYAGKKAWRDYFDLKAQYLDIRDKAACTVYKSQGSTYDTVFIDLANIGESFNAQQVARMLYVGVSRARSRVCFYGTLPPRYHSSNGKPLWTPKNGLTELPPNSASETTIV